MILYVIRHAEAVELGVNGVSADGARPLTERGRQQASALGAAFARLGLRPDHLVTSPLVRARQTAELFAAALGGDAPPLTENAHLAPDGRRRKLTASLAGLEGASAAVFGHNPDLSEYVGWLIGSRSAQIELAKGAAAKIEFDLDPAKGGGTLDWIVTPEWFLPE